MLQVSTHGSIEDQIHIWKYPSMTRLATLTSHSSGVHYLAVSPDGVTIVTGGGDETLHRWQHVFSRAHSRKVSAEFVHVERYIFLMDHIDTYRSI
jgi:cell division cycle 20-like protein 1 (cofactor of APC complex)